MGWLPALTALTAPPDSCSQSASAICERALLPVHRNSTRAGAEPRRARGVGRGRREGRVQRDAGAREQLAAAREIEHVVGVAAVGGAATQRDQPTVAQPAQVVGDQALAPARQLAQLAHAAIAARQLAQQPPPQRVPRELQKPRR